MGGKCIGGKWGGGGGGNACEDLDLFRDRRQDFCPSHIEFAPASVYNLP